MQSHCDHYEGSEFGQTTSITAGPFANPRRYRGWNFRVSGAAYSWNRTVSAIGCEYVIMTQSRAWLPHGIHPTITMVEFLTRYCASNADIVRYAWWEFLDTLLWKYNAGFMNDGNRISSPGYPVEWLERVIELDEPDHYKR